MPTCRFAILLLCLTAGCAYGPDAEYAGEVAPDAIAASAKTWKPGDPIPGALLEYRDREGCIPAAHETAALYGGIENVPLLLELVSHPDARSRTVDVALERALVLDGPTRVFGSLSNADVPAAVRTRMDEPNVWVSAAIGIDEADKPSGIAKTLVSELMDRVASGEEFEEVYGDLFRKHATLTNVGDFVLSASHPSARPLRDIEVPTAHVERLLEASAGDLVLMRQETPHHGNRLVVYQVEEVYRP